MPTKKAASSKSSLAVLREFKVTRPLHSLAYQLHHHPIFFLSLLFVVTLLGGALLMLPVQAAHDLSFVEALWVAFASSTTSEAFGIEPDSLTGRYISGVVAFIGVLITGSFVAALTALVLRVPQPEEDSKLDELSKRLTRIEELLQGKGEGR